MDEPVLSLDAISLELPHLHISDFSLEVRAGQAVAILGPLHSGKLDLLEVCAGMREPDQGRVVLFGQDLSKLAARRRTELLSSVAFIHEMPLFLSNVRFYDNLALPLRYHSQLSEPEIRARVEAAAQRAGIADFDATVLPMTYPRHFLKRASYARALSTAPRLMLIAEIMAVLDDEDRDWLTELLLELKREGLALVYSSRLLESAAAALCDHVIVLDQGRVVTTGNPALATMSAELAGWRARMREKT